MDGTKHEEIQQIFDLTGKQKALDHCNPSKKCSRAVDVSADHQWRKKIRKYGLRPEYVLHVLPEKLALAEAPKFCRGCDIHS
jgi:hypothetical protein